MSQPRTSFAKPCPLCAGEDWVLLWDTGEYMLNRCRDCGLVANTLLTQAENLYADPEYHQGYLQDCQTFIDIFQRIVVRLHRHRRPPGNLLDVGCSVGLLLQVAKEREWHVEGVEVSPWAAEKARANGLTVHIGDLSELPLPTGSYDVIVFNHVLEHLSDPLRQLRRAWDLLKPTGLVVVGMPNFASPMARIEREHWPALQPLEHRWQFTPQVLRRLLSRSGFTPISFSTEMQPRNYQRTPKDTAKRALYILSSWLNLGETMLVIARRVEDVADGA
ncbi:MAG: class I SAM-dependent methyltransferase [Chloroflexi bacterium]|nr:class I SAM-dependent methyltransferase [Chloroflexota bacterium]